MRAFNWTDKSADRNKLTEKYEPVQPIILFELLSSVGANQFIDVGANIGYYTILMSQLPRCENIISFEADKETFSQLIDNVVINGLSQKVHCIQRAVSSSGGSLQFQIADELSGINSVVRTSFHKKELFRSVINVEACTLDSLALENVQAIGLKIDVEGHELEVLQGARQTLERNKCVLQVETYEGSVHLTKNLLESMKYRKIFSVGNDYYYSNIPVLFDLPNFLSIIETAMGHSIEYNLGRWPKPSNLPKLNVQIDLHSDCLSVSCEMMGQPIGGPLEYAFYVIANGQRVYTRWYERDSNLLFDITGHRNKEIVVQGFARDVAHPSRKVIGKAYARNV